VVETLGGTQTGSQESTAQEIWIRIDGFELSVGK
jgi:hypothetical protein